jgi:nucleotidyltransferase substrate binding protein (TIGR01987 family)
MAPLIKAFGKFERFRVHHQIEQEKAGIIQAFAWCFELSWKTMKRLLQERGKVVNSPKEAIRMSALEGFIEDPEIWFDFLKKRNLTVHTYNEEDADQVIAICPLFSHEIHRFLRHIINL